MKLAVIASGEVPLNCIAGYLSFDVTELVAGEEDDICRCVRRCATAAGLPLTTFSSVSGDDPSENVPSHYRQMIAYADELLLFWDGRDRTAEPIAHCAEMRDMNVHLVIVEPEKSIP